MYIVNSRVVSAFFIKRALEVIQNNAMRIMCGTLKCTPIVAMQHELSLLPLQIRRDRFIAMRFLKFHSLTLEQYPSISHEEVLCLQQQQKKRQNNKRHKIMRKVT